MKKDSRKLFEKKSAVTVVILVILQKKIFFSEKKLFNSPQFFHFEVKRVTYFFFHEPINFVKSTFSAQSKTLPAKFENIIPSIFDATSKANKSFGLEIDK